jgi:hypothetical protein
VRRRCRQAGHPPVAVGRLPADDLADAGAPQLAAPVALGDLGPLGFGNHPLHLGEQPGLGVVVQGWGVDQAHHDPEPGRLVQHQHLPGVGAGQPVRRQAPDQLKHPGLGRIPQSVPAGAVQARPRVAVVTELGHDLVALAGGPSAQRLQLGGDRAPGLLRLGRHPSVECHPHQRTCVWQLVGSSATPSSSR